MLCAIWYNLHKLKNVKNTHGGVLKPATLLKIAPPCVFFTFLKLYKCYQIAQSITYNITRDPFFKKLDRTLKKMFEQ